tara:strand:+ start:163 stop:393 length:231 start_codon:yes stop_codon:yes gene_type:complete
VNTLYGMSFITKLFSKFRTPIFSVVFAYLFCTHFCSLCLLVCCGACVGNPYFAKAPQDYFYFLTVVKNNQKNFIIQ